jgi:hypothetical protein
MNKNQIIHKEMHNTVNTFLDGNTEKWAPILKVTEFKNKFSAVIGQIEQAQEAQLAAKVYIGKDKKELKKAIADQADVLNDSLEVIAIMDGNEKLASKMNETFSELNEMRNEDFIPKIKEIIKEAEKYSEVLEADYGITAMEIEGLKSDMNHFLELNGKPRAYQVASIQATKDLEQLFEEAEKILATKLDKVIKIFKHRDPNFYNGYLAARVIVDK